MFDLTGNLFYEANKTLLQINDASNLLILQNMENITFMMIKPDAVENGFIGNIIEKVTSAGFKFKALKLTKLSRKNAEQFYKIHKDRHFYGDLVKFISRSPILVAVLEKENAVSDFRTLIGATNPNDAAEGTIRKLYAKSVSENAVHGSDSDENALIEASFHFASVDLF